MKLKRYIIRKKIIYEVIDTQIDCVLDRVTTKEIAESRVKEEEIK